MTELIALPVRGSKIAPIFDFSPWFILVQKGAGRTAQNTKIHLAKLSPAEKVRVLMQAGVKIVICGCISDSLQDRLELAGIKVIWGITGPILKVLEAFQSHRLDASPYRVLRQSLQRLNPPSLFRYS